MANDMVRVDEELNSKLDNYVDMIKNNGGKASKKGLVNDLLADFFKDRILTNDFIELDRPFYINLKELFENKIVTATLNSPIHDFDNIAVIKKIPNDLDTFNKEYDSYCYENIKNAHRGCFLYHDILFENGGVKEAYDLLLVFDYSVAPESLKISCITLDDLAFLYNDFEDISKFLESKELFKNDFHNYCRGKMFLDDFMEKYTEVIERFTFRRIKEQFQYFSEKY